MRLSLLISRWKHAASVTTWCRDAEERIHRLEIANRQLKEHLDLLEEQQERLWARWKGSQGGRPRKVSDTPQNPQQELDAIPRGDKAALRRHFGLVPRGRSPEQHGDEQ